MSKEQSAGSEERASEKMERLALEFIEKLRGRPRSPSMDTPNCSICFYCHLPISRMSVRESMLLEFADLEPLKAERAKKYGQAVDDWIQTNIELLGEVIFCEEKEGL